MIEPLKLTKRNKLGGLVVPVSWIGAAGRPERDQPKHTPVVGLRLNGSGQIALWPDYYAQGGGPVEGAMPFRQWYQAKYGG